MIRSSINIRPPPPTPLSCRPPATTGLCVLCCGRPRVQIREKSKTFNLYVIIVVLSVILAVLVFSGLWTWFDNIYYFVRFSCGTFFFSFFFFSRRYWRVSRYICIQLSFLSCVLGPLTVMVDIYGRLTDRVTWFHFISSVDQLIN